MNRDYFIPAEDNMVEYLTEEGKTACGEQLTAYHMLRERAYKLLVLLLAGSGSGISLYFSLGSTPLSIGMLLFALGWSAAALIMVFSCLSSKERPIIGSHPGKLYFSYENGEKVTLGELKRIRLHDYTTICDHILFTVGKMSRWFNRSIKIAAFTPPMAVLLAILFLWFTNRS
jgi:hypothetical protein